MTHLRTTPKKRPLQQRRRARLVSRPRVASPLRRDPSRTATLRRIFLTTLRQRFGRLERALRDLIREEDALGRTPRPERLVLHTRWAFLTSPQQRDVFEQWLRAELDPLFLDSRAEALWEHYVERGFRQGAGRAFADTRAKAGLAQTLEFYAGSRDEFLRSAFAQPEAVAKVQLLAGRTFAEIEGMTQDLSVRLARALADGLVRGEGPATIARALVEQVGFSRRKAELIVRTELIRAHAEGQLLALEALGVEQVGVDVEWLTAENPCAICSALAGRVYTVAEAHGLIPAHVNCRCAWAPVLRSL